MSRRACWSLELIGHAVIVKPDGTTTPLRSGQAAAVLAMLWDENRPVRREELAERLWGEGTHPVHWAGAVRGVITKARGVLERAGFPRDGLVVEGGTVQLQLPQGATTDLAQAAALVERASIAQRDEDFERAGELAGRAATRLSEPVAVQGEGDWMRRLHLRIATHAGEARRIEIETQIARGRYLEAISAAETTLVFDPFDEVAHGHLIRANLAAGRPVAARRAHAELVRILDVELGIEPDQALAELLDAGRRARAPSPAFDAEGFLGRVEELTVLTRCSAEVVESSAPALVVIEGPAGIGKTRLARTFVDHLGVPQLWGRCHADSGVAFEPFVEAFDNAFEGVHSRFDRLGESAFAGLARLRSDRAVPMSAASGGDDRAAVMRDVVRTITNWAGTEQSVLVIDDLQWAAGDTLALLSRVLEDTSAPLLVVVTVREGTAEPGAIAEALRAAPTAWLPLTGIGAADLLPLADEILSLVEIETDRTELAERLYERTGGLPYYLAELARDVRRRRSFDVTDIPEPVRAWVRRRVEALPDELRSLLEVAAVVGASPSVELIETCWVGPSRRAVDGLERLVRLGLLVETDSPDRLAFPHQITREVVEAGIGATRRARLHERVAEVLLDRGGDLPHALLAHHLRLAGPTRRRDAVVHRFQAAAESLSRSAWDLADDQLMTALAGCRDDDAALRASLLLALGRTRHAQGRPIEAVGLLGEAAELATMHRLPHHLARATLHLVGRGGRGAALGMGDEQRIDLLRGAILAAESWPLASDATGAVGFELDAAALADLHSSLEIELSWAMLFVGTFDERRVLLDRVLARARQDPTAVDALAKALVAQRNVLQGPGDLPQRLAATTEALNLPATEVASETLVAAHLGQHEDLVSLGDREGARAALADAEALAERHGHPYWRWAVATWKSLSLLVEGDPDAAEAALMACRGLQPCGSPEVDACQIVQLVAIRLHQGRAGEIVEVVRASADAQPQIPAYRAVQALCQASSGDLDGAAAAYRTFADRDFSAIPVDSNRLLALAVLGDTAVAIGDPVGAATLDALLEPDNELDVVLNCYGGGGAWWGPVAGIRARLAAVRNR